MSIFKSLCILCTAFFFFLGSHTSMKSFGEQCSASGVEWDTSDFGFFSLWNLKRFPHGFHFPDNFFSNWELLCSTSNHYLHLESAFFSNDEFFQFSRLLQKASLLFLRPYVRSFACFCSFTAWGNLFIDTTMSFLDDVGNFSYGPGKLCDLYKKCIVDLKFRLLC